MHSRHASRPAAGLRRRADVGDAHGHATPPLPSRQGTRARTPRLCLSARPSRSLSPRSSLLSHSLARSPSSPLGLSCGAAATSVRGARGGEGGNRERSCCSAVGSRVIWGEVQHGRQRQMNDCSFVVFPASLSLTRTTGDATDGRPNERLDDIDDVDIARVNECESVKLCLNGDVSDVWRPGSAPPLVNWTGRSLTR